MKSSRRRLAWTIAGSCSVALAMGVISSRGAAQRAAIAVEPGLHDAVAAPPAPAATAAKPAAPSWVKTPEQRRAEMNKALLGKRKTRAAGETQSR